jgi:phosphinothricin acetyltransferase
MNIRFEALNEDHLPSVLSIYNWYVKNATATLHTEPITLDALKEIIFIGHPLYKSYLIFSDERMAGYGYLTKHKNRQGYDRTAEITIYLKPEFQKQGIGRIVLAHLEKQGRSAGFKNLIGGITGDNVGSIALFEKAGFIKCAHFKNVAEKFNTVLDVVMFQKEI